MLNHNFSVYKILLLIVLMNFFCYGGDMEKLRNQFTQMPMEARRLNTPYFWLHGTESKERLEQFIDIITEGHNGGFCAESRPHNDWMGPGWFRDLDICLQAAKKNDLIMWILDERWWPSQTVGGKVPKEYAAKLLDAEATIIDGPKKLNLEGCDGKNFVAVLAGKVISDGIDGDSLTDLSSKIKNGVLKWDAPTGKWQIMKFTWKLAKGSTQTNEPIVDGASQNCVDWYLKTVYQPHYDKFKKDFGKTIVGFFYDEPETQGDWGTEMGKMFAERKIDWKKAFVAWKFKLAGEEQIAAKYAYLDTLFETWGRTMYGSITKWCEKRKTESIGHFMEHIYQGNMLYLDHGLGAGNIMQVQKYSSMGGVDLVCKQVLTGQRSPDYQLAKIGSSISHVYNKRQHIAMCEIFGGYNQDLEYMEMKWLTDHHQVRGINFMITHSFNPKAPNDTDYPPYFYNDDQEPRWPLYRVWADYSNRLSLMLTGGKHVCPVAFLFCGNSKYTGKAILPDAMTTVLQDALFDCDWMAYDAFEDKAVIKGKELKLYDERYKILLVPPVEVIPYSTMLKIKKYFDAGGTVVSYAFLPSKSATIGKNSNDIQELRDSIWQSCEPKLAVNKTNKAGGRSYLLPENITSQQLAKVLCKDAEIIPTLQVVESSSSQPSNVDYQWLHVLHRVKEGCDVFLICNQYTDGGIRNFKFKAIAKGIPQHWDPMRNEITRIPYKRLSDNEVEFKLAMSPYESAMIVFDKDEKATTKLPEKLDTAKAKPEQKISINNGKCTIPNDINIKDYRVYLEMEGFEKPTVAVKVNNTHAGGVLGEPLRLNVTCLLHNDENNFEFQPYQPASASLIFYK